MVQSIVLIGHVLVAVLIVVVVLLQRGKGAEAGTGFGAGASATVFGARGSANFFTRATALLAALFFATSLTLAYFSQQQGRAGSQLENSVLDETPPADASPAVQPADNGEKPAAGTEELPEIPDQPSGGAAPQGEPNN